MQYFQEARQIWKIFVPRSGQASTVQGELLRAVEKLRDEAIRNGNGNWDRGFEILLNYLREHLLNAEVYSASSIEQTRDILERLRDYNHPLLEDEAFDLLGDRVVEYFQHFGSQPHNINANLHR